MTTMPLTSQERDELRRCLADEIETLQRKAHLAGVLVEGWVAGSDTRTIIEQRVAALDDAALRSLAHGPVLDVGDFGQLVGVR